MESLESEREKQINKDKAQTKKNTTTKTQMKTEQRQR